MALHEALLCLLGHVGDIFVSTPLGFQISPLANFMNDSEKVMAFF